MERGCFDHLRQEQGTIGAADGGLDGAHMVQHGQEAQAADLTIGASKSARFPQHHPDTRDTTKCWCRHRKSVWKRRCGLESWASFPDRPNSLPNSNVVMMTRGLGHLRVVGQIQHLFVDDRGAKDGHRVFQKSIFSNMF